MHVLIIGGTSGLGLELAKRFKEKGHDITVTGRKSDTTQFRFCELAIGSDAQNLTSSLSNLVEKVPEVNLLIYVAGYFQEGRISDLSSDDIYRMEHVGLTAPALLLRDILKRQNQLQGFIAITSTSQWTPRELEPIYTAVKAGLGMLAQSISLDVRVGKVLVVGPAGMKTKFWEKDGRDTSTMLEPAWVASQVIDLYEGEFSYRFAKVLREPPRLEIEKSEF